MKICLFEDKPNEGSIIRDHLEALLRNQGIEAQVGLVHSGWHIVAERQGSKQELQIWLIDINGESMSERLDPAKAERHRTMCKTWMMDKLEAHKDKIGTLYDQETELKSGNHLGLGVAIKAWETGVPFRYVSKFYGNSEGLLQFLVTGRDDAYMQECAFEKILLTKRRLRQPSLDEYQRVIDFIKGFVEGFSIYRLTAKHWREMRGANYSNQTTGMVVQLVQKAKQEDPAALETEYAEFLTDTFYPHHCESGSDDMNRGNHETYQYPEKWARYLFPENIRHILEDKCRYNWATEFDKKVNEGSLGRPPGRALIQNTPEAEDLSKYIRRWSQVHAKYVTINPIELSQCDYLWLNIPSILYHFEAFFQQNPQSQYRLAFLEQKSAEASVEGLLMLCRLDPEREYNEYFPFPNSENRDLNRPVVRCVQAFFDNGALWVFYGAEGNGDFQYHVHVPKGFSANGEGILWDKLDSGTWSKTGKQPTLVVYVPAEQIFSPFRREYAKRVGFRKQGLVPLSHDELIEQAATSRIADVVQRVRASSHVL